MYLGAFPGISINDYRENPREYLDTLLARHIYCAKCGGEMYYHCSYERSLRDNNKKISLIICRIACAVKECHHTDAVLPCFILPHKQYSANEVESVVLDENEGIIADVEKTEASEPTVRRWIHEIHGTIKKWIGVLTPIAKDKALLKDDEKEIQCSILNDIDRLGRLLDALRLTRKSLS